VRVTVCELHDDRRSLDADWVALSDHCRKQRSELVLLPEMPFTPWLPRTEDADEGKWLSAVIEHESWRKAFTDLVPARVLSTQPIVDAQNHYNEGFSWTAVGGSQPVHRKYYLPNESGFWEANWYHRGELDFAPFTADELVIGFLICTELWFTEHARSYAKAGVNLLAAPRATGIASNEKWLAGGRAAAVMSGAFCLSSNRTGTDGSGFEWGGHGWIIAPEEGKILGVTSPAEPFVTIDIDLDIAARAKTTYPRYVAE
jgi:N-carbamoylputrescine amidase